MMWYRNWRDSAWSNIDKKWDIIIIGGGITGAGILREATNAGYRTILLEGHDFASGTSSRSSKLVHGGFRYLKNAQIKLTYESVHERERLLREGRGLINPLGFLMPQYSGDRIPTWAMGIALSFYSLLSLKWNHRYYDAMDVHELNNLISTKGLKGGYRFFDAQTDDARLVLRIIREAVANNGLAINYARVIDILQDQRGQARGVMIEDMDPRSSTRTLELFAPVIINATGAWADELRENIGKKARLRKLRGSHLIFPHHRLPLTRAVSIWHPRDRRPVFAFPWEGVTILGTTDVDHNGRMDTETSIHYEEVDYLLAAVQKAFPDLELGIGDIQCTFSGIRSVVDTGKQHPSMESREHVLWWENGMLTVTGGKLTTFRLMARQALKSVSHLLPTRYGGSLKRRMLDEPPLDELGQSDISPELRLRLLGRYGSYAPKIINLSSSSNLTTVNNFPILWSELRWASRCEGVVHLDDLLLRRVRLGLILPHGGLEYFDRIQSIVQEEIGWDQSRWEFEARRYRDIWQKYYQLDD